ncbi:MAG TPA: hypothetical protein DCM27_00890 [Rhodospirillaceae bacterium]|nr:hypothetical protein [Rhodospirillaceae bacterium]
MMVLNFRIFSMTLPLLSVLCLGMAVLPPAFAQESVPVTDSSTAAVSPALNNAADGKVADQEAPELKILKSIEVEIKKKKGGEIFERSSVPSLVFTPSQYALLREARIGFNTRAPTLQELAKAGDPNDPNYRPPVALRDIRLGGIAYNTPDDWTIWLNSNRVTPDALPAEAIDLRVYKDFIEVKWFDVVTNQIFPIRLRMNQRFNLDTRIFLPGI